MRASMIVGAVPLVVIVVGSGCGRRPVDDTPDGGGGANGSGPGGSAGGGQTGGAGLDPNGDGGAGGVAGVAGGAGLTGVGGGGIGGAAGNTGAGAGGRAGATGTGGGAGSVPRTLSFVETSYPTHAGWDVALGDLDGDGWPDIALASDGLGNPARNGNVLLNDGRGQFTPTTGYSAPLRAIALGDLDGDGRLDIAGTGPAVLYNNGDATFRDPLPIVTHTAVSDRVSIADLNGDGHPDLVATGLDTSGKSGVVSVLVGSGRGDFTLTPAYPVGAGGYSIATGDVDGDGDTDLAVAADYASVVTLLANRGDATFETVAYTVPSPHGLALADLDGDGRPEIAVAGNGGLRVMHNDGDGTFTAPVGDHPVAPVAVAAADLNGDGRIDLAVAEPRALYALINLGAGLARPVPIPCGTASMRIVIRDVNADGKPDIVAGGSGLGVCVLINDGR